MAWLDPRKYGIGMLEQGASPYVGGAARAMQPSQADTMRSTEGYGGRASLDNLRFEQHANMRGMAMDADQRKRLDAILSALKSRQ